jgi:hypothetical protein
MLKRAKEYTRDMETAQMGFLPPRQGQEICLFSTASRPAMGPTQPAIQWVPGALSPGVKRQADQSPPCSAVAKNDEAIPPFPETSS